MSLCPICRDSPRKARTVCAGCKTPYCIACIVPWIAKHQSSCPYCRRFWLLTQREARAWLKLPCPPGKSIGERCDNEMQILRFIHRRFTAPAVETEEAFILALLNCIFLMTVAIVLGVFYAPRPPGQQVPSFSRWFNNQMG